MTRSRRHRLILLGILACAALVRALGCFGWGLPNSYYDDEVFNVHHALKFGATGSLDPDWFNKPTLGYYILFFMYGVYYAVGRLFGSFQSPNDLAVLYFEEPWSFFLIGRLTQTAFGVGTVVLTYRLGKECFGRTTGLFAAFALALIVGHVTSCQQVKMDVPSAFFTTWAAISLVRILRRPDRKTYVLAGFLAGLGTATKYYSVVLLVPLGLAHWLRSQRPSERRGAFRWTLALIGWIFGFAAGCPYAFLNPRFFDEFVQPQFRFLVSQVQALGRALGIGWLGSAIGTSPKGLRPDDSNPLDAIAAMARLLASKEIMGPVLALFAVSGALVCLRRRPRQGGLLLAIVGTVVAVLAIGNRQWSEVRHLVVLLPFLAVLAGAGLAWSAQRIACVVGSRWAALATLLVVGLAALPWSPAFAVYDATREALAPDARNAALRWMEDNLPAGTTILNDHGRLPLRSSEDRCTWAIRRAASMRRDGGRPGWEDAYRIRWEHALAAARSRPGRRFDSISLAHPWQTENIAARHRAVRGYDPIMPVSPWGEIWSHLAWIAKESLTADMARSLFRKSIHFTDRRLAPVELWTAETSVSRPFLVNVMGTVRPVAYVVTTRISFDNYRKLAKRENFPDFAAFYDDLSAHYDCREWGDPNGPPERLVRLYDLRQRIEGRPPIVEPMGW